MQYSWDSENKQFYSIYSNKSTEQIHFFIWWWNQVKDIVFMWATFSTGTDTILIVLYTVYTNLYSMLFFADSIHTLYYCYYLYSTFKLGAQSTFQCRKYNHTNKTIKINTKSVSYTTKLLCKQVQLSHKKVIL